MSNNSIVHTCTYMYMFISHVHNGLTYIDTHLYTCTDNVNVMERQCKLQATLHTRLAMVMACNQRMEYTTHTQIAHTTKCENGKV